MPLTFEPPTYDRGAMCVCVVGADDEGEYEFRITRAALQDHFGMKEANTTDAINAYNQNREKIEAEILRRYDLEEFETSGSFHLNTQHFLHLR